MVDQLKAPYGPDVPENVVVRPQDPLEKYPNLQQLRGAPISNDWINDQLAPNKLGTIGRPTLDQLFNAINPGGFTLNGPKPPMSAPVLPGLREPRQDRLGNFTLDMLDLTGTYEGFLRAAGIVAEDEEMPAGSNPAQFLTERDIDLFGMGARGAPARLADYADPTNWVPIVLLRQALGDQSFRTLDGQNVAKAENRYFAFQADPRYWAYLERTTTAADSDAPLRDMARGIATDNVTDPYVAQFEQQIFEQMKRDRDEYLGLRAPNERIEWMALAGFQADLALSQPPVPAPEQSQGIIEDFLIMLGRNGPMDPMAPAPFVPTPNAQVAGSIELTELWGGTLFSSLASVPFMGGDQVVVGVPIKPETRAAWEARTPAERRTYIEAAAGAALGTDVATMIIGFGGLGAIRALATAGRFGNVGKTVATGYDVLVKTANVTMATGLINAGVNWGLEAASPQYREDIGQYIDASRPVSGSWLAGYANALGYFASGTYGAAQATKLLRRGAGITLDAVNAVPAVGRFVPRPIFGMKEIQFARVLYGGQRAINGIEKLTGGSLSANQVRVAVKAHYLSTLQNTLQDTLNAHIVAGLEEAASNPLSTHPLAPLLRARPDVFDQVVSQELAKAAERMPKTTAQVLEFMRYYHDEVNPLALEATEQAQKQLKILMRTLDDQVTQQAVQREGTRWEGLIDAAAVQTEARRLAQQSGWQIDEAQLRNMGTARGGGMDVAKQQLNGMRQAAYTQKYAELLAAAKQSGDDASELSIGSLRHLYDDEVDLVVAILRGEAVDPDLFAGARPNLPRNSEAMREWVRTLDLLPEDVYIRQGPSAEELADMLEEVRDMLPSRRGMSQSTDGGDGGNFLDYFQRNLESGGDWTIIKKPRRYPDTDPRTEASPLERSITGSDRAAQDFASMRRLRDRIDPVTGEKVKGKIYKSPWIEYPMGSLDQIELGNRGVLGHLIESVTTGTRAWRMTEFQRANLHRQLNTRYAGLTENQINELHKGMQRLAREPKETFRLMIGGRMKNVETDTQPGQDVSGALHTNLSLQGWAWQPKAAAMARETLGEKLIDRKTGLWVEVDWNRELARSYQQSMKLNLLAGATSRLKANPFLGPTATWAAEQLYVMWRFGLSPIFKVSEYVESAGFNLLRGVYWDDPITRDLILRATGRYSGHEELFEQLGIGETMVNALGSSGVRGSLRDGSAEIGANVLTGSEAAIERARQVPAGQVRQGAPAPDDLRRSVLNPSTDRSLSNDYTRATPIEMLPDAEVRDGALDMAALIEREVDRTLESVTPEQALQAGRVYQHLERLSTEAGPLQPQPLRMHPGRNTRPQSVGMVALHPDAYDRIIPTWGDMTTTPGQSTPVLSEAERTTLGSKWQQRSSERRRPAEIQQWADEYVRYRIGERADLPEDPARWARDPRWARQRQAIVDEVERIGVGRGREPSIDLPPEGQALAELPGTVAGTPLTPAGVARMRQIEYQRAVMDASPNETMADIIGRANATSNVRLTSTVTDHRWEDADAIFLTRDQNAAWQRFMARTGDDHPARNVEIRFYDGTEEGLNRAYATWTLERAGMPDLASRKISSLGLLDEETEQVARTLDWMVQSPEFRQAVREAATQKRGFDVGEPMVRAYQRYDPQTQQDQLIVTVTGGDGRSLGLTIPEIEELWQTNGLPTTFGREVSDDAVSFLRNQGPNAAAFERGASVNGRIHIYRDPDNMPITARIDEAEDGSRVWVDPNSAGIDIIFGSRFVGSTSYQPVSDLYPRFDAGRIYRVDDAVHYAPEGQPGWTYRVTQEAPDGYTVRLDDTAEGYQLEEQLRDAIWRFRDKTVLVELPNGEAADAYMRLWMRGELPGTMSARWRRSPSGSNRAFVDRLNDLPGDTMLTLYHGTTPEAAQSILASGRLLPNRNDVVGVAGSYDAARTYGPVVLEFRVPRSELGDRLGWDAGARRMAPEIGVGGTDFDALLVSNVDPGGTKWAGLSIQGARVTDGFEPFNLAAMRVRYGIPEDVANDVPVAIGAMEDIPFTPEALMNELEQVVDAIEPAKGIRDQAWAALKKVAIPVPFKLNQEAKLQALFIRNTFADVLQRSNPSVYKFYRQELKVPHDQITRYHLEARTLYEKWVRSGATEDLDALASFAGKYNGKIMESADELRAFYDSEDWQVLSDLWLINARVASQDAFTTHFFSSYRSALERSLNHPLFGIYPLSWAYKAGREWALFMFNNRMLGLKIGMTPAVAIKHIQEQENKAWAMNMPYEGFGKTISSRKGAKFSSLAYMANLMLPGDWSSIPFPMASTVRDVARWAAGYPQGKNPLEAAFDIPGRIEDWGITRDIRLFTEAASDLNGWLRGPQPRTTRADSPGSLGSQAGYRDQLRQEQQDANPR